MRQATQMQPLQLAAVAFAAALEATDETTKEQPPQLAADSSPAALGSLPPELWEIFLMNSPWVADRTIMLRMTSKRVKELVHQVRPPALVRWRSSFMDDKLNAAEKLQLVFKQLAALTAGSRITTHELCLYDSVGCYSCFHPCSIKGKDVERLARVLAQCPALIHLNLGGNQVGAEGAEKLAGVLAQCTALAHLNLSANELFEAGAESLAGVLGQCAALAHLDLSNNFMQDDGTGRLAGVLAQCTALADQNLCSNFIGSDGVESLAGVLAQCAALAELNLGYNTYGNAGAKRLMESWRGLERAPGGLFVDLEESSEESEDEESEEESDLEDSEEGEDEDDQAED